MPIGFVEFSAKIGEILLTTRFSIGTLPPVLHLPIFFNPPVLTIRLSRTGRTKQYSFRIVLQDHRESLVGTVLEILGHYQPAMKNKPFVLEKERVSYWISKGAKPSDTVAVLLKKNGFSDMDKFIGPRNKKRKVKGEEAKSAEAKPAAETKPEAKPAAEPATTPAA